MTSAYPPIRSIDVPTAIVAMESSEPGGNMTDDKINGRRRTVPRDFRSCGLRWRKTPRVSRSKRNTVRIHQLHMIIQRQWSVWRRSPCQTLSGFGLLYTTSAWRVKRRQSVRTLLSLCARAWGKQRKKVSRLLYTVRRPCRPLVVGKPCGVPGDGARV